MLNWQVPMILKITYWTPVNTRQQENWKNRSITAMEERERENVMKRKRRKREGGWSTVALTSLHTQSPPPLKKKKKKKNPGLHSHFYCINRPPAPTPSQPPAPHGWTADTLQLRTKSSHRASDNRTPTAKERKVLPLFSLSLSLTFFFTNSLPLSLCRETWWKSLFWPSKLPQKLWGFDSAPCVCVSKCVCVYISPAGCPPAPQSVRWGELRVIFPHRDLTFFSPLRSNATHFTFLLNTLWYAYTHTYTLSMR